MVRIHSAVASVQSWIKDHSTDTRIAKVPMLYLVGGKDNIGGQNGEPFACSRVLLRQFVSPATEGGAR